jgi:hypothetical protein
MLFCLLLVLLLSNQYFKKMPKERWRRERERTKTERMEDYR